MSKEMIKALKCKIKELNSNFTDNIFLSDDAFLQIVHRVTPEQIEFGCRVNKAQAVLIGLYDSIIFAGKMSFGSKEALYHEIKYEEINDVVTKIKLVETEITIVTDNERLKFDVMSPEGVYIIQSIKRRIGSKISKDTVQKLKNKLKEINPVFNDHSLISDDTYSQIVSRVSLEQIIFGCMINMKALLIGLQDRLIFAGKGVFGENEISCQEIKYEEIGNMVTDSKFLCTEIMIVKGRKELKFEVSKLESEYIVTLIEERIVKTIEDKKELSLSFNLDGIEFNVIGRNFEEDFKLISEKKNLYFQRKVKSGNEKIRIAGNIKEITQLTEENKSSLLEKAGWGAFAGAIGGLIAAPFALAGLFAGIAAKGQKKEVCFACELKTGEKFLAKTDNETFQKLLTISML